MAQLSRPFQIGLAAVAVFAAAWLLLLNGHGRSSSESAPSPAQVSRTPAHSPGPSAKKSEGSAGSATGHGSASSIGGLGHSVEKARGAVTTSRQNEKQLTERSNQASSETTTTSTPKPAETTGSPSTTKSTGTASTPATKTSAPAPSKPASPAAGKPAVANSRQHSVEAQLAQGKIAVILFWDPKGADDRVTRKALGSLRGNSSLKIAIDEAPASQVTSFGTITRGVQVYGTPTLLFVNKHGRAVTLTGLQPAYAIAQAVREARHA
ncbi:MAG: hypothetical protein JWM60_2638 [Solirubrobacterales bacterium]|nr:hypothetical protein [Solirubrobacterales bacterium]